MCDKEMVNLGGVPCFGFKAPLLCCLHWTGRLQGGGGFGWVALEVGRLGQHLAFCLHSQDVSPGHRCLQESSPGKLLRWGCKMITTLPRSPWRGSGCCWPTVCWPRWPPWCLARRPCNCLSRWPPWCQSGRARFMWGWLSLPGSCMYQIEQVMR